MKRIVSAFALTVVLSAAALCDEPEATFEDRSILALLASEKMLAYQVNHETQLYDFTLLSDDRKSQVRDYYKDPGKAREYRRLEAARRELFESRTSSGDDHSNAMTELQQAMAAVASPVSGSAVVVSRYGLDYIVVRSLHPQRPQFDTVIPLHRISRVIDNRDSEKQPPAVNDGDVPNDEAEP
jgi:hypothetical protein